MFPLAGALGSFPGAGASGALAGSLKATEGVDFCDSANEVSVAVASSVDPVRDGSDGVVEKSAEGADIFEKGDDESAELNASSVVADASGSGFWVASFGTSAIAC